MKIRNLIIVLMLTVNLAFAQNAPQDANDVLKDALKVAKAQNKKVFIKFSASWCGWCHKMDDSMNDPKIKSYFDKKFVIRHLTVMESKGKENLENPGAMDMIKKYNSDGFGIPLWFIFDADGKLLVDSHIRPEGTGFETKGKNIIGCPASKEEVDLFVKSLKMTTNLTDVELAKIAARFRQNDPNYKPNSSKNK